MQRDLALCVAKLHHGLLVRHKVVQVRRHEIIVAVADELPLQRAVGRQVSLQHVETQTRCSHAMEPRDTHASTAHAPARSSRSCGSS